MFDFKNYGNQGTHYIYLKGKTIATTQATTLKNCNWGQESEKHKDPRNQDPGSKEDLRK